MIIIVRRSFVKSGKFFIFMYSIGFCLKSCLWFKRNDENLWLEIDGCIASSKFVIVFGEEMYLIHIQLGILGLRKIDARDP